MIDSPLDSPCPERHPMSKDSRCTGKLGHKGSHGCYLGGQPSTWSRPRADDASDDTLISVEISAPCFDEIRETLERAGYAFYADTIECEGMELVRRSEP